MKNPMYILALLLLIFCSKQESGNKSSDKSTALKDPVARSEVKKDTLNVIERLKALNKEVLQSLKMKDYEKFSSFIHPEKGVTFSMYSYVNPEKDKHFSVTDFRKYITSPVKFTWGEQDGTGDLLILPVKDYLEKWVFKKDFTQSQLSINSYQGQGNTINNIRTTYEGYLIENYIAGTEEYGLMDWNSLFFVFSEHEGEYYLVAVVNNSWTTWLGKRNGDFF